MGGKLWTKRERLLLRQLARSGEPAASIAAEIGRSEQAVRWQSKRMGGLLGHHGPRRSCRCPFKRARLLDLLAEQPGLTLSGAARILGRSVHAVRMLAVSLVRDGLLARTGGATHTVRYRPTAKWTRP